jgi:hypothetical protein
LVRMLAMWLSTVEVHGFLLTKARPELF